MKKISALLFVMIAAMSMSFSAHAMSSDRDMDTCRQTSLGDYVGQWKYRLAAGDAPSGSYKLNGLVILEDDAMEDTWIFDTNTGEVFHCQNWQNEAM